MAVILAYRYKKSNKISSYNKTAILRKNDHQSISGTPLHLIRNQYFPLEQLSNGDYYINSSMEEVFNIFLRLSPSIVSTLTKAERRMLNLKAMITDDMLKVDAIKSEIEYIDSILDELVKASHSMIEKLEEFINIDTEIAQPKISVNKDVINIYMNAVNILMDLTDNHSITNYEIHALLVEKYPELIEPFRIISGKITYLFFVNLISYSNKIDQNIYIAD